MTAGCSLSSSITLEDVRKLTPAESKKKRPALRREATLDSMEYNILNNRY